MFTIDIMGWTVSVLDSATNHLSEHEVRQALASQTVQMAIQVASANGTILQWNGGTGGGTLVLPNGWRLLIRHESQGPAGIAAAARAPGTLAVGTATLVVFHADRGDNYKAENVSRMQARFDEGGSYADRMRARQPGRK